VITVAVTGLGDIAPIHFDALKNIPGVVVKAVCDIDESRRSVCPGVPFYTDYQEMLEREKPDCVHLCLPHYLHYPAARTAAEKGIHVFCEKPMATDLDEAMEFAGLEAAYPGLYMGICLQNRRNRTTEYLKRLIDGGSYGRITGLRGFVPWQRRREYYQTKPWRGSKSMAGSGVMLNQAIHTLDLLYYLGGEINSVKALAGRLLDYDIEVEDTVAARLGYTNGASGLFFATVGNYKNESVSLRIELEKGEFLIQDNQLIRIDPDGEQSILAEDDKMPGSKFYFGSSHKTVMADFYQAIEDGTQNYIHVKDAWMGMKLVDAIFESAWKDEQVTLI